mgnify:CR=1 FL=1
MNALFGIAIASSLMNGLLNDGTYWLIYIMCLVIWTIFIVKTKNPRENGKRKTLMLATWNGKFSRANNLVC